MPLVYTFPEFIDFPPEVVADPVELHKYLNQLVADLRALRQEIVEETVADAATYELTANKDVASGYVGLDGDKGIAGLGAAPATPGADVVYINSLSRGWVRFSMSGAGGSVTDSFNVTDITDHGTGDFSTNWNTDFANANYAYALGTQSDGGESGSYTGVRNANAPTAGALRTQTWTSGGVPVDVPIVCVHAFGDQS